LKSKTREEEAQKRGEEGEATPGRAERRRREEAAIRALEGN